MKYMPLLLLALLFSCKEKQTKVTLGETKHLINIDIPNGEVLLTSSLVKKPRTIILEDHADAVIGSLVYTYDNNALKFEKGGYNNNGY